MAKWDKKDFVQNLAETAEKAAALQDLYTISKMLRGGYSSANRPVKDENSRVLSQINDNLKRWEQHLHSILNRPDPKTQPAYPMPLKMLT